MHKGSGQQHRNLSQHRVVITGAGIITSMGQGWRDNAEGFRQGRQAFGDVTLFDTSRQRVHQAGEVSLPEALPDNLLPERQLLRLDRASNLLLHATAEALRQAGWSEQDLAEEIPIVLGTSAGAMFCGEEFCRRSISGPNRRRGQASRIHQYQAQHQALLLENAFAIRGPVNIISNACASGANAIGHAFRLLKYGHCQKAVAGGYDALSQLVFAGFDSLQALTQTLPPRPFDLNRDGLALGEGAGVLMLETLQSAQRRGAEILAELSGYGASTDIHHLAQPHPQGDAALTSMTEACEEAKLNPEHIHYINSHGTGTPKNDVAEGMAIARWAGSKVGQIKVSSTKACIGHLLGGAGAVETVISLMALREQWLPPTTTIENLDPVCTFDLVRQPREAQVNAVLTNSFGFGGANATLILKQFD
ncbi:MAG: beta-ketoacyl-[acyl-carrier-protein] synthase family protein [Verrucomicrobiales bacterium]|nr:beta-ketoacyl-[acyl-carrier-protein] synthase family protein [Verrucomicrobiales bacterium]